MKSIRAITLFSFIVYGLWLMTPPVEAAERFFEVKAKKFSYTPNIIKVNKGDKVNIRLISEDVHHGFFVDGYGVKTSALPGQEGALSFTADKSGRFSFRCSVTCGSLHPYMIGYFYVGPNNLWVWGVLGVLALGLISWLVTAGKKQKDEKLKLFGIIPLGLFLGWLPRERSKKMRN